MTTAPRQLRLAAFFTPPGSHYAGWRMPDARSADMEIDDYVAMAQLAERGKLDMLFFQDSAAVASAAVNRTDDPEVQTGAARVVRIEPLTLLASLAMVTKHLGLVATATTTYNEPYHIARRFASVDAISRGRAGWNLVTSQFEDEAFNFGADHHMEHGLRYERAAEFFEVVAGLWRSWDPDAILRDKDSGRYFDPAGMHVLRHEGRFFKVRGPLNVAASPQGRPIVAQAGTSGPGRDLAARIADLTFTAQTEIPAARAHREEMRERARGHGRSPDAIKVMPGLNFIVAETESEARAQHEHLMSMMVDRIVLPTLARLTGGVDLTQYPLDGPLPPLPQSNSAHGRQDMLVAMAREKNLSIRQLARHFATANGHQVFVGTPKAMAEMMETWLMERAADGFMLLQPWFPTPLENFVKLVVPELQKRGVFRREYEGTTLRENLGLPMPE
ncbi:LLM class flavin-dependent oxidoreductase [Roseomonas terrae]|uniref:LLM class flavin-dependent oxidoreductase n=2 Tax=Neoroseomonas terrae TaxID=424799 RepID=A0ABS5EC91_9PROT|nr:LLM class flavin-dependent oxidoreductase [Neoroseomonas terrae]MBR0648575.1 LLM class flavin-dependent oxidoreductase [Neoroseomonas terrae]